MGNKRIEIREKLKELIQLDVNFTSVKVFTSRRSNNVQDEELPSITIVTSEEPVTPESLNRKRYIRKTELRLELRVTASDDVDDVMDDLLSKLEDFMITNSNLEGILLDSVQQTTETDIGVEGNKEIGLGVLVFECTYIA